MSGHIGDMDDLATLRAFGAAEAHLRAADRGRAAGGSPPTGTRRTARAAGPSTTRRRPTVVEVQHHHAHVASTMAEHGVPDGRRVIGVAFDGTGYGDDGAVLGRRVPGRRLPRRYERAAHLALRRPARRRRRRAQPVPDGALPPAQRRRRRGTTALPCVRACDDDELGLLDRQLETGLRCVPTSSMGRLFDAVASLAGICHRAGYDAQAAMELEALARPFAVAGSSGYRFDDFGEDGDPAPVVGRWSQDVLAGAPTPAWSPPASSRPSSTSSSRPCDACASETGLVRR